MQQVLLEMQQKIKLKYNFLKINLLKEDSVIMEINVGQRCLGK